MERTGGIGGGYTPTEEELAAMEAELAAEEAAQAAVPPPQPPTTTAVPLDAPTPAPAPAPAPESVPPPPAYATEPVGGNDTYFATTPSGATLRAGAPGTSGAALIPYDPQQPPPTPGIPRGEQAVPPPLATPSQAVPPPPVNAQAISPERRGDLRADMFALVDASRPGPPQQQRPGTPGTGEGIPAPFNPAVASAADSLLPPTTWDRARLPSGEAVRPVVPPPPGSERSILPVLAEGLGGVWQGSEGLRNALGTLTGVYRDAPTAPRSNADFDAMERIRRPVAGVERPVHEVLGEGLGGLWQGVEGARNVLGALTGVRRDEVAGPTLDLLAGLSPPVQGTPTDIPAPPPPDLRVSLPQGVGDRPAGSISGTSDRTRPTTANALGLPFDLPFDPGSRPTRDFLQGLIPPPSPAPTPGANPVIAQPSAAADPLAQVFTEEAGQGQRPAGAVDVLFDDGLTYIMVGEQAIGVKDENGNDVIFPADITQEDALARVAEIQARVAAKNAAAPATSSAAPSGGGSSGGGGGAVDYGNAGGGRRSERRSTRTDFDDFVASFGRDDDAEEPEFTAEDFLEEADGDRKRAAAMAKAANKRRRKGRFGRKRGASRGTTSLGRGFPFQRQPSPIRANILAALSEAFGRRG